MIHLARHQEEAEKNELPLNRIISIGPGHHHVDVAAAAPRTDEPLAPLGNRRLGATRVHRTEG
jgi:hypothetical protein